MKKITVILPWVKETKGTHQYQTDQEGVQVPTVYVRKDGTDFKDGAAPKSIKVEISEAK